MLSLVVVLYFDENVFSSIVDKNVLDHILKISLTSYTEYNFEVQKSSSINFKIFWASMSTRRIIMFQETQKLYKHIIVFTCS